RIERGEHAAFVDEAEHISIRERIVSDYPTLVVDSERLRGYRTWELEGRDFAGLVGKGGENRGGVWAFLVKAGNSAHIVHAGRLAVGVRRQQMVDIGKDRAREHRCHDPRYLSRGAGGVSRPVAGGGGAAVINAEQLRECEAGRIDRGKS